MQVVEGIQGLVETPPGVVISIGNFDGVHRGHQEILRQAQALRQQSGGALVVATFEPHPLTVLRPQEAPPRLTPASLKRKLLENLGVDRLVVLPPTPEVLNVTAEQFWKILRDQVRPAWMVEGMNFTFGKGRGGDVRRLLEWSKGSAIQVRIVEPLEVVLLDLTMLPASSTLIRWLLAHGRVRDAAICLGHPFTLEGSVVEGHRRGRTIGIPTANLDCGDQMVPAEGVYTGRCVVNGRTLPAAVSIGRMQTFGATLRRQVEAHLINFEGDLYGQVLRVELRDWIREQRRFADVQSLKRAIAMDIEWTLQSADADPTREIAVAKSET